MHDHTLAPTQPPNDAQRSVKCLPVYEDCLEQTLELGLWSENEEAAWSVREPLVGKVWRNTTASASENIPSWAPHLLRRIHWHMAWGHSKGAHFRRSGCPLDFMCWRSQQDLVSNAGTTSQRVIAKSLSLHTKCTPEEQHCAPNSHIPGSLQTLHFGKFVSCLTLFLAKPRGVQF